MSLTEKKPKTRTTGPSWSKLLREYGPTFLSWLREETVLEKQGEIFAAALSRLLKRFVVSRADADAVWAATEAVRSKCNEQSTYQLPGAPVAYAWLHLLDRYSRTWQALERLVYHGLLPLASHGIRVLDVGTGPGPAGFAAIDFYDALTRFERTRGVDRLNQPCSIDCIEFDEGTNHLRHNLAEKIAQAPDDKERQRFLSLCNTTWADFNSVRPAHDRLEFFKSMRRQEYRFWDEDAKRWDWEPEYSVDEAHQTANSLFRYRLIIFSNFLTSVGTVSTFESNLSSLLQDANAGTVMMLLGGKKGDYPSIYDYVDKLARGLGFDKRLEKRQFRGLTESHYE